MAYKEGAPYVPMVAPPPPPDVVAPFNLLAGECAQVVAMAEEVMSAWVQVLEQRPRALMRLCAIEQGAKPGMPIDKPVAELSADVASWMASLDCIRSGIAERGVVLKSVGARMDEASATLVAQDAEFRRRSRFCVLRKLTGKERGAATELAPGAAAQAPAAPAPADELLRSRTQVISSAHPDALRSNMRSASRMLAKDAQATREKIDPTRVSVDAHELWHRTRDDVRKALEQMRVLLLAETNSLRQQAYLLRLQGEAHQCTMVATQVLIELGSNGALSNIYAESVCDAVSVSSAGGGALSAQSMAVKSCGHAEGLLKSAMSMIVALGELSK